MPPFAETKKSKGMRVHLLAPPLPQPFKKEMCRSGEHSKYAAVVANEHHSHGVESWKKVYVCFYVMPYTVELIPQEILCCLQINEEHQSDCRQGFSLSRRQRRSVLVIISLTPFSLSLSLPFSVSFSSEDISLVSLLFSPVWNTIFCHCLTLSFPHCPPHLRIVVEAVLLFTPVVFFESV